jgi:membrane-associated phospholipid phosphatase
MPVSSRAQETSQGVHAGSEARTEAPRLTALGRCSAEVAKDQAGILRSPARIRKKDFTWLVPFAAATATALVLDRQALDTVSSSRGRVDTFRTVSNFTGLYMPLAAIGTSWVTGAIKHNDHLRETGFLAGEALVDTMLFTEMIKYAANRIRPQASGLSEESGEFWPDGKYYRGGDSFPSGHTAAAFAFAHVVADEYPSWKVKLAVYGLAAATAFERVAGREHFPSDVLAGGAIGHLIGGYVFHLHHAKSPGNGLMLSPMVSGNGVGTSLVLLRSH